MTDYVARCPVCGSYKVDQKWYNTQLYWKCRECGYVFQWPPKK